MNIKKIGLASDHAGYDLKEFIKEYLNSQNIEYCDYGCNSTESTDYPDYAHPLATAVEEENVELGISVCGSGNGINMTANKHQGVRAALCWNSEISELARSHNNANICSLPARFISQTEALDIIKTFINTDFEGGRHQRRIDKMPLLKTSCSD